MELMDILTTRINSQLIAKMSQQNILQNQIVRENLFWINALTLRKGNYF